MPPVTQPVSTCRLPCGTRTPSACCRVCPSFRHVLHQNLVKWCNEKCVKCSCENTLTLLSFTIIRDIIFVFRRYKNTFCLVHRGVAANKITESECCLAFKSGRHECILLFPISFRQAHYFMNLPNREICTKHQSSVPVEL